MEHDWVSNCIGQAPAFSGEPVPTTQKGNFPLQAWMAHRSSKGVEIYWVLFALHLRGSIKSLKCSWSQAFLSYIYINNTPWTSLWHVRNLEANGWWVHISKPPVFIGSCAEQRSHGCPVQQAVRSGEIKRDWGCCVWELITSWKWWYSVLITLVLLLMFFWALAQVCVSER